MCKIVYETCKGNNLVDSVSVSQDNRGRLISLGDIMRKYPAADFVMTAQTLGEVNTLAHLSDKMLAEAQQELGEASLKQVHELLGDMKEWFDRMELVFTSRKVQRCIDELTATSRNADLSDCLGHIQERLRDELDLALFLAVDSRVARFFEQPHLFGEEVTNHFPTAIIDIDEAGKCLALDRGTASIFHLMRVMEVGLRTLAKSLNDPSFDPAKKATWDTLLSRCDDELKKPLAKRSPDWAAEEVFYSGVAARLRAVKDAWRNPTMHVEVHYSPEQAQDIWNHVGAFMRHLATKLSE